MVFKRRSDMIRFVFQMDIGHQSRVDGLWQEKFIAKRSRLQGVTVVTSTNTARPFCALSVPWEKLHVSGCSMLGRKQRLVLAAPGVPGSQRHTESYTSSKPSRHSAEAPFQT